jgi:hypothetical protein
MDEKKQELIDLNEDQKKDLLKVLLKNALEDNKKEIIDNPQKIEILKELRNSYEKKYDFKVGDIIRWKNKLKNRKLPEYEEPIIILEILDEPIYNTKEQVGSTYFNEKIDIKIGVIKDNSLLTFYLESARFELFE